MNKLIKTMYITVLDFEEGRVFQYDVDVFNLAKQEEYPLTEHIEDFLVGEGHRLLNCEWMSHADGEIITDKAEI